MGVVVELNVGMSQAQVIDRINDFSAQTGAMADAGGVGGATRVYTEAFGNAVSVDVISNVAAAGNTSGFGTTTLSNTGIDVQVRIGGNVYTGQGNVVTASGGSEKGLTLAIAADTSVVATVSGGQGTVDVTDKSLAFQIGPNANQNARIAINKAAASSLGIGAPGNQFANLGEIKVLTAAQSDDSLAVIDQAIDDITTLRGELGCIPTEYPSSHGKQSACHTGKHN